MGRAVKATADKVDSAVKIATPIYAILAAMVGGGIWFGSFMGQYNDYAQNGSPALKVYIEKANQRIDRQDIQIANQQRSIDLQEQRVKWLEDRK